MARILLTSLILSVFLTSAPASAQYMFLDTNSNGVHDSGDIINLSGLTYVQVILQTDHNRDGSSAVCTNGGTLTLTSYDVCMRTVGGQVTFMDFVNTMTDFTTDLGSGQDGNLYHYGFGGTTPQTPGTYTLFRFTLSVQSGNPYITFASNLNSPYPTAFGSGCIGHDFDNFLKYMVDWFDVDGAGQLSAWQANGIRAAEEPFGWQVTPAMVTDGFGGALVAWSDLRNNVTYDIYAQRLSSSGQRLWSTTGIAVCTGTGDQAAPKVADDGAGGAFVIWDDPRSGNYDAYLHHVLSGGAKAAGWPSDGLGIGLGSGQQHATTVVPDGSGGVFASWYTDSSSNFSVWVQSISSAGILRWGSSGIRLSGTTKGPLYMAADGSGGAVVIYNEGATVHAQRISSTGTLQWGVQGVTIAASGFGLSIVSDTQGGAILTQRSVAQGSHVFLQRVNASGTLQWGTGGIDACPSGGDEAFGFLVPDGSGGAIVCWYDDRVSAPGIYVRAVGSDGTLRWNSTGVLVCTGTPPPTLQHIATDGLHGAVIVWKDDRNAAATETDIYAQRISAGGTPVWTSNGKVVCNANLNQYTANAAPDGLGGGFFSWEDHRGYEIEDTFYVYVSRIAPNGGDYATDVAEVSAPRKTAYLMQNQPNPFNPRTAIRYSVPDAGKVRVEIFDVSGRLVRELFDGWVTAGEHEVTWNGIDRAGRESPSQVYLYRLTAKGFRESRKMILLK